MSTHDILHRLSETLASRRNADPETSYTAKLFAKGPDSILKKIGEELNLPIDITTYVARHSFATVLKRSGVREKDRVS